MTFYDNFISICKLRNIPAGTVCSDCGLSQGIHSKWKDSVPKSDAIIKIAKYLNVSIDYLLTGKDVSIPTEYQSLISSYEQLSKDNKQLLKRSPFIIIHNSFLTFYLTDINVGSIILNKTCVLLS